MPVHEVECPVCFATLKLKAPPKPGAKLRCPKCDGVFSLDGDPVDLVSSQEDKELLVRPKGRVAAKPKKKKSKPINWLPLALAGGAVVVLVGLGVGLYLAKDLLLHRSITVDPAFCRLEKPTAIVELRPQEFLQAKVVPEEVRNAPSFMQSNPALRELLGIEFSDLESIQAQAAMPAGFNPMTRLQPAEQLLILKGRKPLTRPQTESTEVEGVACYAVHGDPPNPDTRNFDAMFFADASTAVLGSEQTIRGLLGRWKSKTTPAPLAYKSSGDTVVMFFGEDFVWEITQQLSGNPMLAVVLGPQAGGDEDFKKAGEVIRAQSSGFSVSLKCADDVSLSVAVHGRDSNGVQQLQTALDGLRTKLQEPLKNMAAMSAMLPPQQRDQLTLAQQVLSTPVGAAGDRVTISIPLPAEQQTAALKSFTASMPTLIALKPGRGATAPSTAGTSTQPQTPMSPGMPSAPGTSTSPGQ